MLVTSPVTVSFLQLMLGCGLAAATWVIVKYPTEKTQERMTSDRVQPEMHLVLGTLLPELAVNLERLLLWVDLTMRGHSFPVYIRYPVLNLVAYVTAPLWFALLMMAMVFLLLVVSVISFGFMIPWVVPVLGLLLGYALLVPVWVISVYSLSLLPLLTATFVGSTREAYVAYLAYREHARARKMVRTATTRVTQARGCGAGAALAAGASGPPRRRSWISVLCGFVANEPREDTLQGASRSWMIFRDSARAGGEGGDGGDTGGSSVPRPATAGGGQRNPTRQSWLSKKELLQVLCVYTHTHTHTCTHAHTPICPCGGGCTFACSQELLLTHNDMYTTALPATRAAHPTAFCAASTPADSIRVFHGLARRP